MIFLTSPGKTYSVNSVGGCTISAGGTTLATIPANIQTTFIAPDDAVTVSDDNAIIVEVTGVGAGGSGGSGEGSSGGVTAEAIQAVAPIDWSDYTEPPTINATHKQRCVVIGGGALALSDSVVIGFDSSASSVNATALGKSAIASVDAAALGIGSYASLQGVAIGAMATTANGTQYSTAIGMQTKSHKSTSVTIGAQYTETVDGTNVTHTCKTEGTGSITIGAGANTLNNGTTESSNSVTIGCKASNSGADSVVIGAQAKGTAVGCVVMGAGASTTQQKSVVIGTGATNTAGQGSVCIGNGSSTVGYQGSTAIGGGATSNYYGTSLGFSAGATQSGTAIGNSSTASGYASTALGVNALAKKGSSIAIGYTATVNDIGTIVFAVNTNPQSTADAGWCKTQFYIAGANTPLAIAYEDGEAMMGYVVTDSVGKKLAAGTQKLSALFPNNSTFQPATVDENGEWVMPRVFHPSDLDLPTEEPSEPEEYTPLPVYPIVEPEIEEIPSES